MFKHFQIYVISEFVHYCSVFSNFTIYVFDHHDTPNLDYYQYIYQDI
jgi:hypothetical protein